MLEKARPATFVTGRSSGGVSGVYDRHAYLAALRYAVSKCKRWAKALKRALIGEAASGPCGSRYTLQPMTAQVSCCTGLFALVLVAGSVALPDKTVTSKAVSEIHQLFVQDQKDRGVGAPALSSYEEMNSNDEKRRTRVHELLNSGALKSGEDFHDAAFIYQHGQKAEDYLLAHVLAMVAVQKGHSDSRWIEAATLDRYLQAIKQPQAFGTQYFQADEKTPYTQDPYNRDLLSDSLRRQFCVPSLETQKDNIKYFDKGTYPPKQEIPGCSGNR
jgi:hypothetical protein